MTPEPIPAAPLALSPAQIAATMEDSLVVKAHKPKARMFTLAVLAGMLIGLGFVFVTTALMGSSGAGWYGLTKVVGGLVFSVGLIMVVITGADLFTSTTMTVLPLARRRLSVGTWLAHWGVVYLGNFAGALLLAALIYLGGTPWQAHDAWGATVLSLAIPKMSHTWGEAFVLGILCNLLVCLAVWMAGAGRTVADKVLAIIGPIALFVASGFEHSVANMFFLPEAILVAQTAGPEFWESAAVAATGVTPESASILTVGTFLWHNLVPVTLGNIVGGGAFVALLQGWIHLMGDHHPAPEPVRV